MNNKVEKWHEHLSRVKNNGSGKMPKEVELDGKKVVVDRTVDCRDQVCPRPQLVVRKALKEMRTGEVGEVLIDNPPSLDTVPRIIGKDSILLGTVEDGGLWRIYFRKGK